MCGHSSVCVRVCVCECARVCVCVCVRVCVRDMQSMNTRRVQTVEGIQCRP
jgi:hypothetical protein